MGKGGGEECRRKKGRERMGKKGRERIGKKGIEDTMRKKGTRRETEVGTVRVCSVDHNTEGAEQSSIPFSRLPCPECWQRQRDLGSAFRTIP